MSGLIILQNPQPRQNFLCIIVQVWTSFMNVRNMISTFQHLPSKSEYNLESQDVFPIVFWWGQELSRNSQTETTKILFYAMFCLLQTLDERTFWYSRICSRYCRTLKQKRKWAAKMAICIYERGLMVSISLSMLSCWTAEQWLGKFFPLNFVDG